MCPNLPKKTSWRNYGASVGRVLAAYGEDILVVLGLMLIILATFRWSVTAGLYAAGAGCIVVGILMACSPSRRR